MDRLKIILVLGFIMLNPACQNLSDELIQTGEQVPLNKIPGAGTLSEGPNSTGTLKEGPNSTGTLKEGPNSTGALKLIDKNIILNSLTDNILSPIFPEKISYIEIIGNNQSEKIEAENISVSNQPFSVKSDNNQGRIIYNGDGKFTIKVNESLTDIILKFHIKDSEEQVLSIPVIKDKLNNNLKIYAEFDSDGNIIALYGSSENDLESPFILSKENNRWNISFIRDDQYEEKFIMANLENDIYHGNAIKPDSIVKVDDIESIYELIRSKMPKASPIANYLGNWYFKSLNQTFYFDMKDQGNNNFSCQVIINGKTYDGSGKYEINDENNKIR